MKLDSTYKLIQTPIKKTTNFVAYTPQDLFEHPQPEQRIFDEFTAQAICQLVNQHYQKNHQHYHYLAVQNVLDEYNAAIVFYSHKSKRLEINRAASYYAKHNPKLRIQKEGLALICLVCQDKSQLPYICQRVNQAKSSHDLNVPDLMLRFPSSQSQSDRLKMAQLLQAQTYALEVLDRLKALSPQEGQEYFHDLEEITLKSLLDDLELPPERLDSDKVTRFIRDWLTKEDIKKIDFANLKDTLPTKVYNQWLQDLIRASLNFFELPQRSHKPSQAPIKPQPAQEKRLAFLEEFVYQSLSQVQERDPIAELPTFQNKLLSDRYAHIQRINQFPYEEQLAPLKLTAYQQFAQIRDTLAIIFHECFRSEGQADPVHILIQDGELDVFDHFLIQLTLHFEGSLMEHGIVCGMGEFLSQAGCKACLVVMEDNLPKMLQKLAVATQIRDLDKSLTYGELFNRLCILDTADRLETILSQIRQDVQANWLNRSLSYYQLEKYRQFYPQVFEPRINYISLPLQERLDQAPKEHTKSLPTKVDDGKPSLFLMIGLPQEAQQVYALSHACQSLSGPNTVSLVYMPPSLSPTAQALDGLTERFLEDFEEEGLALLPSTSLLARLSDIKQAFALDYQKNQVKPIHQNTPVQAVNPGAPSINSDVIADFEESFGLPEVTMDSLTMPTINKAVFIGGSFDRPEHIGFVMEHRPIVKRDLIWVFDCLLGEPGVKALPNIPNLLEQVHQLSSADQVQRQALLSFYTDYTKYHAAGAVREEKDDKRLSLYMYSEQIAAKQQNSYTQKLIQGLRRGKGLYIPFIAYYPSDEEATPLYRHLDVRPPRVLDRYYQNQPQLALLIPAGLPGLETQVDQAQESAYILYTGMQDPTYQQGVSLQVTEVQRFIESQEKLVQADVGGTVIVGQMFARKVDGIYYFSDGNNQGLTLDEIGSMFFDSLSKNFFGAGVEYLDKVVIAPIKAYFDDSGWQFVEGEGWDTGRPYRVMDLFGDEKILCL